MTFRNAFQDVEEKHGGEFHEDGGWEWTERYGGTILSQLKSLGCSYDWRRTRFTLDDAYWSIVLGR